MPFRKASADKRLNRPNRQPGPSNTASSSDDEIEVLSEHVANMDNETETDQEKTQINTDVNNEMFVSAAQTQPDEELVVLSSNDKAVF